MTASSTGVPATIPPRRAATGETVAIVSPSATRVPAWQDRVRRGIAYLETVGLQPRLMPHAVAALHDGTAPEQRAADLHAAFEDRRAGAILCSIGGNSARDVIPYLDFELMRAHPKIFQGYSDITVVLWAILKHAGLRNFYGPVLMTALADFPHVLRYTHDSLTRAWFGSKRMMFTPAPDVALGFSAISDQAGIKKFGPSPGWTCVRSGRVKGPIIAGCLETICLHLRDPSNWPEIGGSILMLETLHEQFFGGHLAACLRYLNQIGVFDEIGGLVFGRILKASLNDRDALTELLLSATRDRPVPTLSGFDFGHVDPTATVPVGSPALLDATARRLSTLEPATVAV